VREFRKVYVGDKHHAAEELYDDGTARTLCGRLGHWTTIPFSSADRQACKRCEAKALRLREDDESTPQLATPSEQLRARLAENDKPDHILVQAEIEVDPQKWDEEYGLGHLTSAALTRDVESYVRTILENCPGAWAFTLVKVTAS
jgi:hypothetical protein